MNPTVYLYKEKENESELYLGEFSTLDGLKAINERLKVKLVHVGASGFRKYGWATEKEFPDWKTVQEVKSFFEQEDEFGLIDFEIELIGFGNLFTHDDGECHFRFKEKRNLIDVVKTVSDSMNRELIVSGLLNNPGMYIEIEKSGKMNKYHSFDQYPFDKQKKQD